MSEEVLNKVEYITTTRLGEKGQLTIPKEFRELMHLDAGTPIAVVRVGPGLMLFTERERFQELCDRLGALLEDSNGSAEAGLIGGVAAVIANQERIIANQDRIVANQEKILANQEMIKAK
jgi:AbrB family looped-hinge helix DNA binding protein